MSADRLPAVASGRYFNDSDKKAADLILKALRVIYPEAVQKRFRLAAPVGQMEVWLPAAKPTP